MRLQLDEEVRRGIVDGLVEMILKLLRTVEELPPGACDLGLVHFDPVYGHFVALPARQLAPFRLPQSPDDDRDLAHVETCTDGDLFVAEALDPERWWGDDDVTDDEWDALSAFYAQLLEKTVARPRLRGPLEALRTRQRFTLARAQGSWMLWYVHFVHLSGPPLARSEEPQSAYAAIAPLFWHSESFMSPHSVGVTLENGQLVEVELVGAGVNDATLGCLTRAGAAACAGLRHFVLRDTRVSRDAVERLRALLPQTVVSEVVSERLPSRSVG